MKTIIIVGIILLLLVAVAAALYFYARYRLHNVKDKGNLEASLDKSIAKYIAKDSTVALVIGVYKGGHSFIKGYGTFPGDKSGSPKEASTFQLGSVTKLFTTSLLQILCDRGIVHLDDKIADLLQDKVVLPPSAANTTLRHLATHTSGFPRVPDFLLNKMTDESNPYNALKTEDLYDYLKSCEGKKPEGTFDYSNLGAGLLGHILALKAGSSYEDAVQSALLRPLHMDHTFITIDSNNAGNIIQGYNESGNPTPIWTDSVLTGAGAFLSNASDMLLFIRANVDKDNPLYPTLSKMHVQQFDGNTGLGWMLPDGFSRFYGSKSVLWHNGQVGGYGSYIAIDPASDAGIIILTNKSVDISGKGSVLMRLVNTQSWQKPTART